MAEPEVPDDESGIDEIERYLSQAPVLQRVVRSSSHFVDATYCATPQ